MFVIQGSSHILQLSSGEREKAKGAINDIGNLISALIVLPNRFKAEMWSKIAEEMAIPWRAAEAMHWQLGEQEMARRAGVVPFSLSSSAIDPPATRTRRASTSAPRPRKGSTSRVVPPQLPSLEELTAGVPAFAPTLPPPLPRDNYRIERAPEFGGPLGGPVLPGMGFIPRTIP